MPIPEKEIDADDIQAEIERLEQAIVDSVADLDAERLHLLELESQEPLHILDAQRLMLLDPDLSHKVLDMIRERRINAEWALHQQMSMITEVFEHIEDDYLRARRLTSSKSVCVLCIISQGRRKSRYPSIPMARK